MTGEKVHKEDLLGSVGNESGAIRNYQDFFVGQSGFFNLLKYEIAQGVAGPMPGGVGYLLRKILLGGLLNSVGRGVQFGRSVSLRHPGKICIGDRTLIDDYCLLDARGVQQGEFKIGSEVIVARGSVLISKTDHGAIEVGDHCIIGKNCVLASTGGVRLGKWVGVGDFCFLGGGRYRTDRPDVPMIKQEMYTEGPVVIGENCMLGTGVIVLDGVTIGAGSVIGAGAVIREDVPEGAVITPHQRHVVIPCVKSN